MKVYFSTSISKMTEDVRKSCSLIFEVLKNKGHQVLSRDILTKSKDFYLNQSNEEALLAQRDLTKMRKKADIIFFEVTNQSIGIGQEISTALTMNKPVIALYQEGSIPHILRDEGGDLLLLSSYTNANLSQVVRDSIENAKNNCATRFDFLIYPSIGRYLDWVFQTKKVPRSVFIRGAIEEKMKADTDYLKN